MGAVEKKFGKIVRTLRKRKGYTQEQFADLVETERGYYGGIERGIHSPTLQKIEKIVSALEVCWATLFKHMDRQ